MPQPVTLLHTIKCTFPAGSERRTGKCVRYATEIAHTSLLAFVWINCIVTHSCQWAARKRRHSLAFWHMFCLTALDVWLWSGARCKWTASSEAESERILPLATVSRWYSRCSANASVHLRVGSVELWDFPFTTEGSLKMRSSAAGRYRITNSKWHLYWPQLTAWLCAPQVTKLHRSVLVCLAFLNVYC